ncbi:MAG: Gfo/Idh/MocA family oxidoreductase [Clostridia bacterium]|nr:Gfo/Idh/MocA family oxidoreductase [Clostridia bacterium]
MKKLRLAIIGQGRSGMLIHGKYYTSEANKYYDVCYVADFDENMREKAKKLYPGCETLADWREIFDKDVDIVVNASYSEMHFPITKELLEHGKNVLVEKPFGRNLYECDTLIKTAKDNGVLLAVFQQTFLAPFFVEAKKLCESGKLGKIMTVNIKYNGFSRRWDWQTLQKKLGGSVYNTGPHPIGMALGFLDFDPNAEVVFSRLGMALTSGDAEDYAKILITAPQKPLIDVEISAIDAFSDYNLKIQGTLGTFKCTTTKYTCKYITPGENPERPYIEESLHDANGDPAYCGENLITHEESGDFCGTAFDTATERFYENLYFAITEKAPLAISPEVAASVIGVIEKVHAETPLKRIY